MDEFTELVSERTANIAHHARGWLSVTEFDVADVTEAAWAGGRYLSEGFVLILTPLAQGCSDASVEWFDVFMHGAQAYRLCGV